MTDKAILCVDDEPMILLALIQELKSAFGDSFVYEQALNAELALETIGELEEEGIRLVMILSDWLMPGMKGDRFLATVAEHHPSIKAIMITGQADEEAIRRTESIASVKAVLRKPWKPEELVAAIRGSLGNQD